MRERVDLVWFSEVQWDFLSTRKQRLLHRFSSRWRILFVEPYALGRPAHWLPVTRGNVTVVTMPFLKTVPYRIGRLLDVALFRNAVAGAGGLILRFWLRRLGFASHERIVGLSNVYWGRVAARMPCSLRFYDANDDHLAFPGSSSWLPDYLSRYLERCGLVFSVSPELTARLPIPSTVRCVELGNGVEYDHFATPLPDAPPELAAFAAEGGPLLGYAGAMDWIDTELLQETAAAYPHSRIALLGPAYDRTWQDRNRALLELPNVHWFGRIDYRELPAWVQRFDLALMPLLRDPLKRASHPNKLYEYAAAGVPVLAIEYCSALGAARGVIHIAGTPGEFVVMVPEALRDVRRAERQAFAREHSWDALAARMQSELLRASEREAG
ncbi:glycosyl transferase, group 1 [Chlorobium limicola DSM 245]|uniref:Glycosyl transferase, group 1 n=1 Tax=Chlorobium limicola (strain DSM 245 / NBRC 103803 / 6330) TaxID=290315 RepID=B3EHE0_CHLL2|nr:glycosyl transferase, group 1 [Chlorobium limicola DSM 245]